MWFHSCFRVTDKGVIFQVSWDFNTFLRASPSGVRGWENNIWIFTKYCKVTWAGKNFWNGNCFLKCICLETHKSLKDKIWLKICYEPSKILTSWWWSGYVTFCPKAVSLITRNYDKANGLSFYTNTLYTKCRTTVSKQRILWKISCCLLTNS